MDWLKKNHSMVITGAVYCLGFAIFVYASFSPFISYDSYWHLKMGQDLLASGLSPRIDHYSFTFAGEKVASVPYFFQIMLSLFVSGFGLQEGTQLLKLFAFSLCMLSLYFFYRQIKAPWQIIAITLPYIYIFLLFRYNHVRAEIFDSSLVIVALILYLRASQAFTHRNLAYIALLQLFWVNYHAPILGYVIFFGLFLDKAIDMVSGRSGAPSWQRWAGWGLVIFVIGFLNADLRHPIFSVLNLSGDDWSFITEKMPTNELLPNNSFFFVFWLVSGYIAVSLAMRRQYGLALVCCIFAFQSWQSVQLITISGLVVTALLAFALTRVDFVELFGKIKPGIRVLVMVLGVAAALSAVAKSLPQAVDVRNKDNSRDFPVDVADYLQRTYPDGGNIFNRLRHGGYLMYRLAPEFKVYVDGRTNILYPVEFVKRWAKLYSSENFASISNDIDRYDIDFAIYPLEMAWFPLTDGTQSMSAEFVSKDFILLSTRRNNFPLSSRVMFFPMCWQQPDQQKLVDELHQARKILAADSALLPLLETLVAVRSSPDPKGVLSEVELSKTSSHYHRRLLAYAALELGDYERAVELFQSIGKNDALDLLMLAFAAINSGGYAHAEEILTVVLSDAWVALTERQLTTVELTIVSTLLEMLEPHRTLPFELQTTKVRLKQYLATRLPDLKLPLNNVIPQGNCKTQFSAAKISYDPKP